jgi:hypothetical protein
MQKRLTALERRIGELHRALEYQHAVEGIRRGLESIERGKGEPAHVALARIRRRHKVARAK